MADTYAVGIDILFVGRTPTGRSMTRGSVTNTGDGNNQRDEKSFGDPSKCRTGRTVINTCAAVNPKLWPSVGVFNIGNVRAEVTSAVIENSVLLFREVALTVGSKIELIDLSLIATSPRTWEGSRFEKIIVDGANVTRMKFTHKATHADVAFSFDLSDHIVGDGGGRMRAAPNSVKWGFDVLTHSRELSTVALKTSFITRLTRHCRSCGVGVPYTDAPPVFSNDGGVLHNGAFFAWDPADSINGNEAVVSAATSLEYDNAIYPGSSHTVATFTFASSEPIRRLAWDPMVGVGGQAAGQKNGNDGSSTGRNSAPKTPVASVANRKLMPILPLLATTLRSLLEAS